MPLGFHIAKTGFHIARNKVDFAQKITLRQIFNEILKKIEEKTEEKKPQTAPQVLLRHRL